MSLSLSISLLFIIINVRKVSCPGNPRPKTSFHKMIWFCHDFSQITYVYLVPSMCSAFLRVLSVTSILNITLTHWTGWGMVWFYSWAQTDFFLLILPAYSRHYLAMARMKINTITLSICIMSSYLMSLLTLRKTLMGRQGQCDIFLTWEYGYINTFNPTVPVWVKYAEVQRDEITCPKTEPLNSSA